MWDAIMLVAVIVAFFALAITYRQAVRPDSSAAFGRCRPCRTPPAQRSIQWRRRGTAMVGASPLADTANGPVWHDSV
jgi:hypothetical protein